MTQTILRQFLVTKEKLLKNFTWIPLDKSTAVGFWLFSFWVKKKYCQPQRDEGGIHPIFLLLHFIIQHVLSNFSNLGTRLQLFVNIETNLKAIYCFVASEAVIFANIGSYSIHKYQCRDNDHRHGPACYPGKPFRSHWGSGLCCYSFAK